MSFSPLVAELIESLRCLPGVGQKTAQRMAFNLLERKRAAGIRLSSSLKAAMQQVGNCNLCRTLCETEVCQICSNSKRDQSKLCIVEMPVDLLAIEQSASFSGLYFVLSGRLSPLDGIGPKELKLDELSSRFKSGTIKEIILATNPTVEGAATANYISDMAKKANIEVSKLAYGVPFGGELEYVDMQTLSHALVSRQLVE